MQIEIVRHHCRAEDSDGDVKHRRIADHLRGWNEAAHDSGKWRARFDDLEQKTKTDGRNESDDQRLEQTESFVLEIKHEQNIECCDSNSNRKRNVEQKIERDCRANDFSEIACGNCELAYHPEKPHDRAGIVIATCLRQVASRNDAEL